MSRLVFLFISEQICIITLLKSTVYNEITCCWGKRCDKKASQLEKWWAHGLW